jgi:hypothetical protein
METINISYRIKISEQITEVFDFELDNKTFELVNQPAPVDPPEWTELTYRQCSHCPLKVEEHPHCPFALQLHSISARLHKTRSIDEVELEVVTEERSVVKTTAIQHVISSMLGLIAPICGCPKTAYMRPLARFHVPLSNEEETVFRVAGMYLLAQYFINTKNKSGTFSFDGLIQIYDDMHILNKAVASRLQMATDSDSLKNAITLIDMYSTLIPMLLEDQLVEIRDFFKSYLPDDEPVPESKSQNLLEKARAFVVDMDTSHLALEPVGTGSSETPAWLRGAMDEYDLKLEVAEKIVSKEPSGPSALDEILSKSSLSLSLEPVGEMKPEPIRGVAVYTLPDDEPPPKKLG